MCAPQLGVPANILLRSSFTTASYSPTADQTSLNVTHVDTAAIRATVQVRDTAVTLPFRRDHVHPRRMASGPYKG